MAKETGHLYQNPWLAICNAAWDRLLKVAAEFGLTPSSRNRVDATPPPPKSGKERFFTGGVFTGGGSDFASKRG